MTAFSSMLLGLVEGLTEFVPVSSTAHMLLVQSILGIPSSDDLFAFLVIVQLGAIAALLVYFWRDFLRLAAAFIARPFSSPANRQAWFIVFATLPALLAGFLLRDVVQGLFGRPLVSAAIRFMAAAVVLALAEYLGTRRRALDNMTWVDSVVIGLFQILAVFPGASRSGSAIAGGMMLQFDRSAATRFAFLMSAPVMLAAGGYETLGIVRRGSLGPILPMLALGMLVAAVSGWFSIRWLLGFVSNHRLYAFAGYCAALGLLCICLQIR